MGKSLRFVIFGLQKMHSAVKNVNVDIFLNTKIKARFYNQYPFFDEPHFYQNVFDSRPPLLPYYRRFNFNPIVVKG